MIPKLLLATRNPAKVREYSLLLRGVPFQLTDLAKEGIDFEVDEHGSTMDDNARLKALAYTESKGFLVISDDSGLEVDALGGEPGVFSARYAGKNVSDKERVSFLLSRLHGIPWDKRTARFRCIIAIASDSMTVEICEGECRGIITFEPKGDQGFGYDPVFYLPELDKVMAELSIAEKNRVSHRGKAAQKALQVLKHKWNDLRQ